MSITCTELRMILKSFCSMEGCPICQYLVAGRPVKVMKSAAGYYAGTEDEDGGPFCRVTGYYSSAEVVEDIMQRAVNKLSHSVGECGIKATSD